MAEVSPEQVRARVAKGKGYTLVLLKAGPNRDMDEERANEIQMAHLQYLFGLIEDGVILINGPLRGNAAIRGDQHLQIRRCGGGGIRGSASPVQR